MRIQRQTPNRRAVLGGGAGAATAAMLDAGPVAPSAHAPPEGRIQAVCFDAFSIFDPTPILGAAAGMSPNLGSAWFQKIFSDAWLRTAAQQYLPFPAIVAEALDYSVRTSNTTLSAAQRSGLLAMFWALDLWPDVREALERLKQADLRLAFLSNMTEPMLRTHMRRNGIERLFDAALSTDQVQAFKPSPRAYALAMEALEYPRSGILFAPFAAWDAAGAAWFGYPTAWVNRTRQPAEPGAASVPAGPDLGVVLDLAGA